MSLYRLVLSLRASIVVDVQRARTVGMSAPQPAPFEARGCAVLVLARGHAHKAAQFRRAAEVFKARGWATLHEQHVQRAVDREDEADVLASRSVA